jgi:hypothetical protein
MGIQNTADRHTAGRVHRVHTAPLKAVPLLPEGTIARPVALAVVVTAEEDRAAAVVVATPVVEAAARTDTANPLVIAIGRG